MEERTRTGFVRDIVIKVFLILLFVLLITLLFPMPNLTPFYDSVFNNNVQTMKEAAEDYFTTERMPEKVGDSKKLTLKQMLDKKLILPFLDKDGKECDSKKSYVKVTKKDTEYELEVHLSCPSEEDYIVEPIGCYNFCPNNSCSSDIKTDSNGKVTLDNNKDDGKYKLQYLYKRTLTSTKWVNGDYQANKLQENSNVKLVDTKTEYTGKKKVSSGTTLYKHIKYAYKDNWTYDTDWTDEVKTLTNNVKLIAERTLYTGQRKNVIDTTQYKHIKYGYKDLWSYDKTWTDEVKTQTDNLKLYLERTLYTGQKKIVKNTTQYKHIKYDYKDNWKEIDWTTTNYKTSDTVIKTDTRYTVRKTINHSAGTWSSWVKDTTWRDSKPADTSTKQWSNAYNEQTTTNWKLKYTSYLMPNQMPLYVGNRKYIQLSSDDIKACGSNCVKDGYYYDVYEKEETKKYQYMYRTYNSSSYITTDEKVVTDPTSYINSGYSIVKYEYRYKVNERTKYISDTKWTESKTSPSGYTYTGESKTSNVTKYENLGKWVTSKDRLGEYTYNIATRKQYIYKYNNPYKYIVDTKWTESKTSPSGYVYAMEKTTTKTSKYENLGKWVTNYSRLNDYTYNVATRKQYKYRYNSPEKYIEDTIWTESKVSPKGYTYTGEYKSTNNTSYVDLGKWVTNKSELGEYTYNVTTRKLYKYKFKKTTTTTESKWFDKNPGGDWVYANETRKVKIK